MDAVEFLKEKERMCNKCSACLGCPVDQKNNGFYMDCEDLEIENPEEFVAIVERWSAKHPVKTRQSEFLRMFPNAQTLRNGALIVCPKLIDSEYEINCNGSCIDCRKKYWLEEID